jgi:DNA-binding NarL/FixJ family response regulator
MLVSCIVVDDNPHFARAARLLLEREGLNVVGTAFTGSAAVDLVRELLPDLVILDIDLGSESGFDVARRLRSPETQASPANVPDIILVSMHDEEDFADLIRDSTAVGFLAKSDLSARAIRRVLCASGDAIGGNA